LLSKCCCCCSFFEAVSTLINTDMFIILT
jgi:hypothetical protein